MGNKSSIILDKEYNNWLKDLKIYIRSQQIKAAIKVNVELLKVYWRLGGDISRLKSEAKWGSGFYESLSRDLKAEFPNMKGFSITNLKYCKRFYELYNQSDIIRHQVGDKISSPIFSIPWRHHTEIISKCKSIDEALFYVNKTIENGWSRAVLLNFLDTKLHLTEGKAITNFRNSLPSPISDLAQQTLKDPYNFDFLTIRQDYDEKELQDALTTNITKFTIGIRQWFCIRRETISFASR